MKCEQVLPLLGQIYEAKKSVRLASCLPLLERGLVAVIDPYYAQLARVVREEGVRLEVPALLERLRKLEANLRSDLHRSTTGTAKLLQEEEARAKLLPLVGALQNQALAAGLNQHFQMERSGQGKAVGCEDAPFQLALTAQGQRVGQLLHEKITRFQGKSIDDFLRRLQKSDTTLETLAQNAAQLDQALSNVPRGRHHIVTGLLKSGLPPQQALQAFQHGMKINRLGEKNEPPQLATALVRSAAQERHDLNQEAQRLAQAAALLAQRYGNSPTVRSAAKTLLPFPDLNAGLRRFDFLRGGLQQMRFDGEETIKGAARLMGIKASENDLLGRIGASLQLVYQGQLRAHAKRNWSALVIAATAPDMASLAAMHQRLLELSHAYTRMPLPPKTEPLDLALDGLACPGAPAEVASTVFRIAGRLAQQQQSQIGRAHLDMANAFARQITF